MLVCYDNQETWCGKLEHVRWKLCSKDTMQCILLNREHPLDVAYQVCGNYALRAFFVHVTSPHLVYRVLSAALIDTGSSMPAQNTAALSPYSVAGAKN